MSNVPSQPQPARTPGKKTQNVEVLCKRCRQKHYDSFKACPFCPPEASAAAAVPALPPVPATSWRDECREWEELGEAMNAMGRHATAFEVTAEQRRRMASRGERPATYAEILADEAARETSPGLSSEIDRSVGE